MEAYGGGNQENCLPRSGRGFQETSNDQFETEFKRTPAFEFMSTRQYLSIVRLQFGSVGCWSRTMSGIPIYDRWFIGTAIARDKQSSLFYTTSTYNQGNGPWNSVPTYIFRWKAANSRRHQTSKYFARSVLSAKDRRFRFGTWRIDWVDGSKFRIWNSPVFAYWIFSQASTVNENRYFFVWSCIVWGVDSDASIW